ncbi:MAG TPA: hypothetical protein VFX49_11690 [Chloroflexota bacterium]|nr:hypothetical protein [Chloroflexota bacterium]
MTKAFTATQIDDAADLATRVEHFRRNGVVWTRVTIRVTLDDGSERFESDEWPRNAQLGGLTAVQHNTYLQAQRSELLTRKGYTGT